MSNKTKLSVLDLSPIIEGGNAADALARTLDLARHAEALGFHRFWVAEHHNMPGIASAATAVVIGHVAGGTKSIRVGAGGIMLPNHAPLVIAEQFGTLESLYPGRIDLGIGRAPGTDQLTSRALRRTLTGDIDEFPRDVIELQQYFAQREPGQRLNAIPGAGLEVPIWILGSSLYGAQLAAALGLPYAFASHFAPDALMDAITVYRGQFQPSLQLDRPYVMLGFNMFAADTLAQAQTLKSSHQQAILNMRRGTPAPLPPPVENYEDTLTHGEHMTVSHAQLCSAAGDPAAIRDTLQAFIDRTQADEIMLASQIFDHQARLHSYEIVAAQFMGNS